VVGVPTTDSDQQQQVKTTIMVQQQRSTAADGVKEEAISEVPASAAVDSVEATIEKIAAAADTDSS
jgi:hypothetical protein